jgi:hypothetical protein
MGEKAGVREKIDRMTKRLVDAGVPRETAKQKSREAAIRQDKKSK